MISALAWVRKGAAQNKPEKLVLTDEEYARIQEQMGIELEQAKEELENEQEDISEKVEDKYDLENYDKETNQQAMFSNVKGLAYYESNEQDPYIELQEEDEEEEVVIEDSDNLLLGCKTEDDVSYLEVYVYEEEEDNLYVHHDIMLPSFPLCLEWLDFHIGRKHDRQGAGNYVAIGTFDPQVEIWDLDTIDAVFPEVILGKIPDGSASIKSTKGKHGPARVAKRPQPERHVDAVMSISWNRKQRNLLATGSADTTVKLWDLQKPEIAVVSYGHHKNKVQSVAWNTFEPTALLTGGYDKRACCFDSRQADKVAEWKLTADVECIKWDPHHGERFYVSTEDGIVKCFDARNPSTTLFTLHAHDSAVSALDINPHIPGFLVTGSADKQVKLWSVEDKPKCILSRDLDAGKVFSANFSTDSPYVLAVGGSKGKVVLWNVGDNTAVKRAFPNAPRGPAKKELIAVEEDEEIEDEDEEAQDEVMEEDYSDEDGDHV
ncbi:hypothetical protein HDV04_000589 [Boothiomyces sp. JEL0838]|nr:hypothetical protein HDV04_000589 [Boothiomyces sp. JEL0838]